jgi:hypothetical protein
MTSSTQSRNSPFSTTTVKFTTGSETIPYPLKFMIIFFLISDIVAGVHGSVHDQFDTVPELAFLYNN